MGLFSDVPAGRGGTVVAQGSHRRAAQVMAANPQGLSHRELFDRVLAQPIGNFAELTGHAGDVVLCHPLLFHFRGFKLHGGHASRATSRRNCANYSRWTATQHDARS